MGCEESMMDKLPQTAHLDTASEDDNTIQAYKMIERQRGDVFELYHFSRVVGRGTSIVRKVLERNSRLTRICKIKGVGGQMQLMRAFQEVQILKHLSHPNIVQITEYFHQNSFLYLIQEEVPGHTLQELICHENLHSLDQIIEITRQVLIALSFCHQKGYAHKAIQPEHVMVLNLKNNNLLVKLIGFGHAHRIGAPVIATAIGQSSIFHAPEAENERQTDKQDIWGTGITFLELLSGQRHFPNFLSRKNDILREVVERQSLNHQQKQVVLDFMSKMLEMLPSNRISAQEALRHGIFQVKVGEPVRSAQRRAEVLRHLMHYRVQMNLRALFTMYASLNILSVEEKSQNLIQFYNLDKNKDGRIDFNQLVEGIENTFNLQHQLAEENVRKIFAQNNKTEENYLDFNEYLMATSFMRKEVCEKTLQRIFNELDTNKDRVISLQELSRSIQGVNLGPLLKDAGKTEVSFDDFRDMMVELYEQEQQIRKSTEV